MAGGGHVGLRSMPAQKTRSPMSSRFEGARCFYLGSRELCVENRTTLRSRNPRPKQESQGKGGTEGEREYSTTTSTAAALRNCRRAQFFRRRR
jgi:hypothetical protein